VKYDFILTADTLYAVDSMEYLLSVMKAHLKPKGICLIAAKTYYFGVGGGTQMFMDMVKQDGTCDVEVIIMLLVLDNTVMY